MSQIVGGKKSIYLHIPMEPMSIGIKGGLCCRVGCFKEATHEVKDRLQPVYGKRKSCEEHAQKPEAFQKIKYLNL